MPNSLIFCLQSVGTSTANGGTSNYGPPGSGFTPAGTNFGDESIFRVIVGIAGTLSNFSIYMFANNTGSAVNTNTDHNGATANCSITASGTGGFTDSVHSDSLSVNDNFSFHYKVNGLSGGATLNGFTAIYNGTTCASPLVCGASDGQINGQNLSGTSPAFLQAGSIGMPTGNSSTMPAATLSHLFCNPGFVSGGSATVVFDVMINGSAGAETITVTSSSGTVIDTVNTDAVSAGNLVNISATFSATTRQINAVGFWQSVVPGNPFYVGGINGGSISYTGGTTSYTSIGGRSSSQTTETASRAYIPYGFKWTNLGIVASANTLTGSATYNSRITGVTGNQSVTIGSGITGTFQDTTHTDALSAGNFANQQFSGGTSGTLTVTEVFNYFTDPAVSASIPPATALGAAGAFAGTSEVDPFPAATALGQAGAFVPESITSFGVAPAVGVGVALEAESAQILAPAVGVGEVAEGPGLEPVISERTIVSASLPLSSSNLVIRRTASLFQTMGLQV